MSRTFPIRFHLLVLTLVVLVPALTISGLIAQRYATSEQARIEAQTLDTAYDVQRELDRVLDVAVTSVQTLAASTAMTGGDLTHFRGEAMVLAAQREGSVALRDKAGHLVMQVPPDTKPLAGDDMDEAASRRAIEVARSGVAQISGLVPEHGASVGVIEVAAPVTAGAAEGSVVALTFDPTVLLAALPQLPPDWLVATVDRDYRILLRSRDHARFQGQKASPSLTTRLMGAKGTLDSRTLDGVDVFTAWQRSPLSGWIVTASVPRSVLGRPLRDLWLTVAGLVALGLATSALAAFLYARYLGRELRSVSDDAAAMADEVAVVQARSGIREVDEVHQAIAEAAGRLAAGRRHQEVLLAELNHRVKNTLAIIQTLVGRTITADGQPDLVRATLQGRVAALAAAHDALSDGNWQDTDFAAMVRRVLAGRERQVTLEGPSVLLRPRTVVALAQAVQEILAFSLREGALRRGGPVSLTWAADGNTLRISWRESPVGGGSAIPEQDFAAVIIRLCVERQLGGQALSDVSDGEVAYSWRIPARTDLGPNLRFPAG